MSSKATRTCLEEFLTESRNTHAREEIFVHRLLLDIKTAAASRGYYLNSYFDNVDHDGFDVIFDDQDYLKKVQLKTVGATSATSAWEIHKRLLRPSLQNADGLGFEPSPEGLGTEGGVILMEFWDEDGELKVFYYYTDVFVVTLFRCGLVTHVDGRSQAAVSKLGQRLSQGSGKEQVSVPKAAFLKANGASQLLSLMGLHSESSSTWKAHLTTLARGVVDAAVSQTPDSVQKQAKSMWAALDQLCDLSDLRLVDNALGMP